MFFLVDPPGGLFPMYDYNYGLPMYNFLPGSGRLIYFPELFALVALVKALKTHKSPVFYFKKSMYALGAYFMFLFLLSFYFGISPLKIFYTIRGAFPWTLLFSISVLISNEKNWISFFRIIFILLIFSFITQFFFILLKYPPAYLLGNSFAPMMDYGYDLTDISNFSKETLRPISCPHISLIALFGGLFFLVYNKTTFNKKYLAFIIMIAYFSILITATRGWIISYSLIIFLFVLFRGNIFKLHLQLPVILILFCAILFNIPFINNQITSSILRVNTVEKISSGDLTAGGTLARLDEYSPRVMGKFYESPVFGWGFSETYTSYTNGHVGNQSLLLNAGIFGFLLFSYFWYSICFLPVRISRFLNDRNPYKKGLIVIPIVFFGIFFLHSTSGQFFRYLLGADSGSFSQLFFYTFANFIFVNSIKHNSENKLITSMATYENFYKKG